jgi:hypothetical protein
MERSSFDELAEALSAELDDTLIEARLRLTPTERLESMLSVVAFVRAARRPGDGPTGPDRSAA